MTYDSNSTVLMVFLCIIVQGVVQLTTTLLQMVLFADDIVVCMGRKEDMERNLAVMKVVTEKWEMRIQWGETKVLMVSRSGDGGKISVEGEEVEEVDKLKYMYLGVMISGDGGCDDEIEQRVGAAAREVGTMGKEVLQRRELQKNTIMKCSMRWCPRFYLDVKHGQCRGGMKASCKLLR